MKHSHSARLAAGVTVAAGVGLMLACGLAEASESAHHGDSGGAWLTLLFSFINFFIFLYILRRFAWPAVVDFLATRHRDAVAAVKAAEEARREVERIRAEYARKEADLEETRRQMLDEIRQSAARDRESAIRDAQQAATRLKAEAEKQARHELERAKRELREEAVRLAAEVAEKQVIDRMDDRERARLVREFIEGVNRP